MKDDTVVSTSTAMAGLNERRIRNTQLLAAQAQRHLLRATSALQAICALERSTEAQPSLAHQALVAAVNQHRLVNALVRENLAEGVALEEAGEKLLAEAGVQGRGTALPPKMWSGILRSAKQ